MVHSIDTTERTDITLPTDIPVQQGTLVYYSEVAIKAKDQAALILTSPLVLTFGSIIASSCFLPAKAVLCVLGVVVGGMIAYPQGIPRKLFYEGVMVDNLARNILTKWGVISSPYYSKIEEGIYIGALPLKNFHHDRLLISLNIRAVLAVVEDYELEEKTFISEAVPLSDWQNHGMQVLQIRVPDLSSVSIDNLHQAADFIDRYKDNIYIHCKAGRGRSMMCFIAYLIKYKQMTYDEAVAFAQLKRASISLQTCQRQRLQEFESHIKGAL